MVRARFTPVTPDQRIRELRKEFAALQKEEGSPERARRLAAFTLQAHAERQLNMAMHTAQLSLDDDPDAPALLVAAYADDEATRDPEVHLRRLLDLADLARYLDREDIRERAEDDVRAVAVRWIRDAAEHELRHRLRTLSSMRDRAFADDVRDEAGRR